ncbi:MAG: sulfate adenylyltransferase [bacterium]|nr:sulfate adenylyltransferase [bacterium]
MILPHGGKLTNCVKIGDEKEKLIKKSKHLKKIHLTPREISDLEMIAIGGFSPLDGFMRKKDYHNVIEYNRLVTGLPWTIPITLAVNKEEADTLKEGEDAALVDASGKVLAILHLDEKYEYDKKKEARLVYGTEEAVHPGVKIVYEQGEVLLAGKVSVIECPKHNDFINYRLNPADTRRIFKERGWKRVVGFQTRNPVHRAHEYILKCALEVVDGLLLHPIVGETKSDDIPADTRMKCYEVLLEKYYPKERVLLAVNPAAMRYAGPKEAIFHAIVRKNYGCTHFIVGRDHAGVGNYYSPFAAQDIFDEFSHDEIGIIPLRFGNSFYCKKCEGIVSEKTCPHPKEEHFSLSGTKVRDLLRNGEMPPVEFTRPEIAKILIGWAKNLA